MGTGSKKQQKSKTRKVLAVIFALCAGFLLGTWLLPSYAKKQNSLTASVTPFKSSEFPTNFTGPKSLNELLALSPDEIEKTDVALINLLCAKELAGSERLDIPDTLRTLDTWASHVKAETERNFHLFKEHPEKFKNSLPYFRMAMLATVLVQDMQIHYNPEREKQLINGHKLESQEEERRFFGNSKDVFLHGLLGKDHDGTCASMPFLYVAIGRRLGYPVTLATTASHFYVRYEEGDGKHFNVEATEHRAFLTPSDEDYRNPWEMHVSESDIEGFGNLKPLSNKEIFAHSLITRSVVFRSMGQFDKEAEAWKIAAKYLPDTAMWRNMAQSMQDAAHLERDHNRKEALWKEVSSIRIPFGAGYAYVQDKKTRLHFFMTYSWDMKAIEEAVKDFEDEVRAFARPLYQDGERKVIHLRDEDTPPARILNYVAVTGEKIMIPEEFLPPFQSDQYMAMAIQRVAEKRLNDPNSVLNEIWSFYDVINFARHRARVAALTGQGTSAIPFSRERIPEEYWNSIPQDLSIRLSGIKTEQELVQEIAVYDSQKRVWKPNPQIEIQELRRRLGYRPGEEPNVYLDRFELPEEYRENIPYELKLRLGKARDARSEIYQFQKEKKNEQIRRDLEKGMQPGVKWETTPFRPVPARTLGKDPFTERAGSPFPNADPTRGLELTPDP